jgi:hypothetical protein
VREAGGEETKTRRPPEQIKADWHQAADQAQAQGWPPEARQALDDLSAEYDQALAERNLIDLAGFPLTPYDFDPRRLDPPPGKEKP